MYICGTAGFPQPSPGYFLGKSTTPFCNDFQVVVCSVDQVPITNGRYGYSPNGINSTEFLAWNESSRITLRHAGLGTLTAVRQVKLYFYHEPTSGIGLPEISLSGSISDLVILGDPLTTYTILDNQDLTVDDAQVRNLTLALTEPITEPVNRFHIQFSLTDNIQQFAVSEVQLCSGLL